MKRLLAGLLIPIEQKVWNDLETGLYVSHCDPLDVCSQGETEEEAINNLNEAIQVFLSTCYEMGTLNEVLIECGLTLAEDGEKHPVVLLQHSRRKSDEECPNLGFLGQKNLSGSSS